MGEILVKIALTDAGVQRLKPGTYFDTRTPAFGIRVGEHRKTWIATRGRGRRVITLGHYPALSLKEARAKAFGAFAASDTSPPNMTFIEARAAFLAQGRWRPQSKRVLTSSLGHFSWTTQLSKIEPRDVAKALDAIEGSSARAHALKDIRTFFNWCVPRYLSASPTVGLKMDRQPSRDRVLSDAELAAVWAATEEIGAPFGTIVRLLILTGQRCGEIAHLHRDHVERDRLHLPADLTKNGREHWVPASEYVLDLLPDRKGLLFPNRSGNGYSAFASSHRRLLKLSGTGGWTMHDLRRTCATGLARLGTPIHVTERVLNHVSGTLSGIAAVYNRFDYWDEQRTALERWEQLVLGLTNGLPGS